MSFPPDLLESYRSAHYVVFGKKELVLRVGRPSAELDAILEVERASSAAFITAANPRGKRQDDEANRAACAALQKKVAPEYLCYAGEGRDPAGKWAAEPSLLVIGIRRDVAEALGREFRQNAIVFLEKGKAPELVVL
jgi:hypothetical protein